MDIRHQIHRSATDLAEPFGQPELVKEWNWTVEGHEHVEIAVGTSMSRSHAAEEVGFCHAVGAQQRQEFRRDNLRYRYR